MDNVKPYICKDCNEVYLTKKDIDEHFNKHVERDLYGTPLGAQCDHCRSWHFKKISLFMHYKFSCFPEN